MINQDGGQERDDPVSQLSTRESSSTQPDARFSRFSILDLLVLTSLVGVNFGAWAYEPGVGFVVSIVSLPVAIRSLMLFRRRAALGLRTSSVEKVAYVGGSMLTAFGIYSLLALALFGAFCASCFALVATDSSRTFPLLMPLFAVAAAFPIIALVIAVRWMRSRWRRDTEQPRLRTGSHGRPGRRTLNVAAGQRRTSILRFALWPMAYLVIASVVAYYFGLLIEGANSNQQPSHQRDLIGRCFLIAFVAAALGHWLLWFMRRR